MATLPSYKNPPVIEVVCGLTFKPVSGFLLPHYGLYWQRIRDQFPHAEHAAPLGDPPELMATPEGLFFPRVWYVHKSGGSLVQLQSGRFMYNWRKIKAGDQYPRFEAVVDQFRDQLGIFTKFLAEEGLGEPVPTGAELSYINHIERRDEFRSIENIGSTFPDLDWRKQERFKRALPAPDRLSWVGEFNKSGVPLRVQIKSATRVSDQTDIYVMELKARSEISTIPAALDWMERGRACIVTTFSEMTDEKVQRDVWGREQ